VQEVEAAPDRRAAAEMVLIRLCYVADQPTPGELVRRLTNSDSPAVQPAVVAVLPLPAVLPLAPRTLAGSGGGAAVARAAPREELSPAIEPAPVVEAAIVEAPIEEPAPPPMPTSFREVVTLIRELKEVTLYGHLLHSVHLVRFAAPVIELRPQPEAPRDLAARLTSLLAEATGFRWTIVLSTEPGEPTIDEQRVAADRGRETEASDHPLVKAIMAAFPGAKLETVRDPTVDEFRLSPKLPEIDDGLILPDHMPDFAPPDAEPMDDMELEEDL